ncbi:hypothetical protein DFH27DRAFT_598627 [Peziza echinospora]|nr:hypothetical protein DFH27DRAFT_598627 [Peziza echinospora]
MAPSQTSDLFTLHLTILLLLLTTLLPTTASASTHPANITSLPCANTCLTPYLHPTPTSFPTKGPPVPPSNCTTTTTTTTPAHEDTQCLCTLITQLHDLKFNAFIDCMSGCAVAELQGVDIVCGIWEGDDSDSGHDEGGDKGGDDDDEGGDDEGGDDDDEGGGKKPDDWKNRWEHDVDGEQQQQEGGGNSNSNKTSAAAGVTFTIPSVGGLQFQLVWIVLAVAVAVVGGVQVVL